MADQLATPEDLASLLQRDVDTASAVLALEVCTAVVQAAAGGQRILRVVDDSAVVYGSTDRVLRLEQRPVVSVASVTYGGVLLSQGTASGTWRMARDGLWRDIGWALYAGEPSEATVVYTHGYAAGDQRLQLARGATLSLARGLFDNPTGVAREQIDDYAVAHEKASAALDATPGVKNLIRRQFGSRARMVRIG